MYVCIYSEFNFFFREQKGRRKRRETLMQERNIDLLPLVCALTGNQTCNPGMCPEHELNWRPFALQDNAQPTEPHWSGSFLRHLISFTLFFHPCPPFCWPASIEGGQYRTLGGCHFLRVGFSLDIPRPHLFSTRKGKLQQCFFLTSSWTSVVVIQSLLVKGLC